MENILREILSQDKTILSRRDELIAVLDKKIPSSLIRDYTPIKRAIKLNIGENFLVGESDKNATKEKVAEILKSSGMQEARINFVIETFTKALDWDKIPPPATEEKIPPQEIEKEPPSSTPDQDSSSVEEVNEPKEIPQPAPPIKNSEPAPSPPPPINNPQPPPPQQNPAQNTQTKEGVSKNVLIAIIGVLVLIVAIMANNGKNDSNSPAQSPKVMQQSTLPADEPNSYTRGRTDLSLNGMDVGITTAELERNLGKPDRIENADNGYVRYYYENFYAAVKDGIVEAFVSREPKYKTLRGISVGSTYNEVVNKYGSDSYDMNVEGLTLHEYPFNTINGQRALLRFAIDRNNRVDYISMRVVEEPAPENNISENVKQAATAFLKYHESITNKNYSAAFNLFTNERKSDMGNNVSNFSKGYANTIKSEITELKLVSENDNVVVMDYILDARDRADGGRILYQQFSGQVEMVRYGGEWKISDARSKKIKEVMEK